ncbi:MAG: cupin domain-containing protein [Candidatus Portnoybacteria bacterium]|jgi:mannose-6-phosphate isomerase-like protein (cupin superfamily)|nr:cupin domain-containing protein [Candidatus Portnoybacteria bacterium]MDD5437640.1 cupin domain-containing protein [Patescibacteria group bacterium]MDD5726816.1 cupin domain-containing protein [Patescibacteria group bacterium]
MPQAFHANVFSDAKANAFFRKEIVTMTGSQVTLMSIPPGGEVGLETHTDTDQILIFVAGTGKAVIEEAESPIEIGSMYAIPLGTKHNFINTGNEDLKIISVYAPPEHPVGTVHQTKAEADAAEATK